MLTIPHAEHEEVPARDWLAVQVRCSKEPVVHQLLQMKGYETFFPRYGAKPVAGSDAQKPLFPGYIFCRVGRDVCGLIVTTPGVIRILGVGRQPVPVPADEMDAVRRIVESDSAYGPVESLQRGDTVRVEDGPFKGVQGVFVQRKNARSLIVEVSTIQRSMYVELENWSVSTVEGQCMQPQPAAVLRASAAASAW